MPEKILLFIPCYNCENQVTKVLEQINVQENKHSPLNFISEVLIIDNGSTDLTQTKVKEYLDNHKDFQALLVQNKENYNLGGSHKVAFQYAINKGFDYIIVLHGDNQGSISDIMPILESGDYRKYDCCLGSRFKKGSKLVGYSKFRTFGNIVFNILFSIVLKRKIYDLGSGLNLYNVNMLRDKYYIKFPDSLSFNYCMTMALDYYKHSYKFFPLTWIEEDQVSNVRLTSQTINLLKMLISYAFNKNKFIKSELRKKIIENYKFDCIYSNTVE